MRRLEEKIAIVTGSGRGIGQAIALKLAHEGAKAMVNDLDAGEVVLASGGSVI